MQNESITFLSRKGKEKRRVETEGSEKAEVGIKGDQFSSSLTNIDQKINGKLPSDYSYRLLKKKIRNSFVAA